MALDDDERVLVRAYGRVWGAVVLIAAAGVVALVVTLVRCFL